MKEDILEYYPNKQLKHKIEYHHNGCKKYERFFDENGNLHRINKPAIQEWYDNGIKSYESYRINRKSHNIYNPARIWYSQFGGKIWEKIYYINGNYYRNKLNWLKLIKKI